MRPWFAAAVVVAGAAAAPTVLPGASTSEPAASRPWVRQEPEVPLHDPATSSWLRLSRAPRDELLNLTVALRIDADRRADLERVLFEVSDPRSTRYGRHLSLDEVTALLAVPRTRAASVSEHFREAGAQEVVVAPNGDMLAVRLSVEVAEAALNTTIHAFTHRARPGVRLLRASSHYSLPEEVAREVTMVGELLQFPRLRAEPEEGLRGTGDWPNACEAAACKGLVTPAVLAQRYKLPASLKANRGNSMAVAEFEGQFFKPRDLAMFSASCHRRVHVDRVIGKNVPQGGMESELDIEYIRSVAPEIPLTVVYNQQYSLLHWANEISGLQAPPLVHSVSYGNDEAQQSGREYMETCNVAFMKAGVRGLSILFASGDQGVCGREGCGESDVRFKPDFPAASPYITAVGGTNFEGSSIGAETAWSGSGGGFSDTFAVPAYQQAAVAAYKSSPDADLPPQRMWNGTGRGYPDVAALGGTKTPYCVAVQGEFAGVAGTSASSPVVAGVFALLNGLRLAAGKAPLGFLNPFIYQNPKGFQDVTSGKNSAGQQYGFKAIKGWDAATGLGTPDFEALAQLAMAGGGGDESSIVV